MEHFIDCAKAEPLHLKNNTIKEMFIQLLQTAVSETNFCSSPTFEKIIDRQCLFVKFVVFIRSEMNCNFLSSKVKTWFNENAGKVTDKQFSFRFRGKESYLYMQHFPSLILMLLSNTSGDGIKTKLHCVFYKSIHLRNLLSYTVRITDFNQALLEDMEIEAKKLFHACSTFDLRMSPSMWTLCHISPYICC